MSNPSEYLSYGILRVAYQKLGGLREIRYPPNSNWELIAGIADAQLTLELVGGLLARQYPVRPAIQLYVRVSGDGYARRFRFGLSKRSESIAMYVVDLAPSVSVKYRSYRHAGRSADGRRGCGMARGTPAGRRSGSAPLDAALEFVFGGSGKLSADRTGPGLAAALHSRDHR